MEEVSVSDSFTHYRLQLELITATDVTWVSYTSEHLSVGFDYSFLSGPEFALSTRRVPLLTYGGWELYPGERAFRYVSGEIRIPFHPYPRRSWPIEKQITEIPLEVVDGFLLSNGPNIIEIFTTWWRPRTIGAQTRVTHLLGDLVLRSVIMTDWIASVG